MTETSLGRLHEALVSNGRIAYRRAGSGPPLVLLHGGVEDSRVWTRQFAGLSDAFTVLAWDAPGCGKSSDVPESWRLNDYADALASWLRVIGIGMPHVLGLSWGSAIALAFYRRHADVPTSLILASAYAGWAGSLPADEVARRLAGALAAADDSSDELLKAFPGLFGPATPPELIEEARQIAADNSGRAHPGGFRAMAHSMAEADLRDTLPAIRVPTLLLYGALDERSPLHVARALHAQIPGAELEVIPGVGHLANLEAPDAFNQRIRDFIQNVVVTA